MWRVGAEDSLQNVAIKIAHIRNIEDSRVLRRRVGLFCFGNELSNCSNRGLTRSGNSIQVFLKGFRAV